MLMNTKKIFNLVFILTLVLPLLPTGSAFAANFVQFKIKNRSGFALELQLNGPKSYELEVKNGSSKHKIEPGIYTYTHRVCGKPISGVIDLRQSAMLEIPMCPPIPVEVTFDNRTGAYLAISLSNNKASYTFNIPAGKHVYLVIPGLYRFQATGCGGATKKGKISIYRIKDGWIWMCRK